MAKQLLIYNDVQPINLEKHNKTKVGKLNNFGFTMGLQYIPILMTEFKKASLEYPIVFVESEDQVPVPIAILSVSEDNGYLNDDLSWDARYIPAFIRRYPFVFSRNPEGDEYFLCIDESSECISESIEGERIFEENGDQTPFIRKTLEFLQAYQIEHNKTLDQCKLLKDLNLFDQKQLSGTINEDPDSQELVKLSGFLTVDRARVTTLNDDKKLQLMKDGLFEQIIYHWMSLEKFNHKRFNASTI